MQDVRVLLIGGTSHAGKTTLAEALASRLGWRRLSTDELARHPGRPWGRVPDHVKVHYRSLMVDELTSAQHQYYERLWPTVERLIDTHASDPTADRLVLEGSGILPARFAAGAFPNTVAYWLVADVATLAAGVRTLSRSEHKTADEKLLIEKFLGRTMRYNELLLDDIGQFGLDLIDVGAGQSTDELVRQILKDDESTWRPAP